jgi:threonine synthase
MRYYSLNNPSLRAGFREATLQGQAPDKGLYFPETVPVLPSGFVESLPGLSEAEIAYAVIRPFVGDEIPEAALRTIVEETVDFAIPLVRIDENIFSLELYHGPTLAFKDVGARFMSRCLGHFVNSRQRKMTVLVATSGDTGGAVADGFYGVEGVDVVILYPSGKVSGVQEKQLTTLGRNIHALEVSGSFDDCQRLVKTAFMDRALSERLSLTSANSINVARWLPQQFYYFFALRQWTFEKPPVVSVPSGNFGNICAGLLARQSVLPMGHFIAACNANAVVPAYMKSGAYVPKQAVPTISNAMDVGDPSNFVRILELFGQRFSDLTQRLSSISVSDDETRQTLLDVYGNKGYLLDPHGAVGYHALQDYLSKHPGEKGILLETAHPVKFHDVVEPLIGQRIEVPAQISGILSREKRSVRIGTGYPELADFLHTLD